MSCSEYQDFLKRETASRYVAGRGITLLSATEQSWQKYAAQRPLDTSSCHLYVYATGVHDDDGGRLNEHLPASSRAYCSDFSSPQ